MVMPSKARPRGRTALPLGSSPSPFIVSSDCIRNLLLGINGWCVSGSSQETTKQNPQLRTSGKGASRETFRDI
jgi:hypothetical protein